MAAKAKTKEERLIELLKKKGEITLKARYGKTQGAFIICPVSDPVTGQMLGVKNLSEEDKKKEVRVVDQNTTRKIEDGTTFKASNPVDVIDWEWIVYNEEIVESRKDSWKGETSLFFVDDVEAELEEKLSNKELVLKANVAVSKLSADAKVQALRLLGIQASHMSPQEISSFLYDKADSVPQKILDIINDSDAKAKVFALDLIDKKVIEKDPETDVYLYGTTKIGTKFESVVAYLNDKANAEVVAEMRKAILPI